MADYRIAIKKVFQKVTVHCYISERFIHSGGVPDGILLKGGFL